MQNKKEEEVEGQAGRQAGSRCEADRCDRKSAAGDLHQKEKEGIKAHVTWLDEREEPAASQIISPHGN